MPCVERDPRDVPACGIDICLGVVTEHGPDGIKRFRMLSGTVRADADEIRIAAPGETAATYALRGPPVAPEGTQRVFMLALRDPAVTELEIELLDNGRSIARETVVALL